ncbi:MULTISPECIES: restriction endonuclease subunit S [Streptococcus]|nr:MULTISPECIES: restriction endonuclease subunit S [Streptococcus]
MTKQPSYRFVRYTEAWEQRKLGEVAQYRNGKAHENCIDENGKYIVVNSKFISTDGEVKKFSNKKNEALFENEIAFVLSDVPNGRAIARTFWVEKNDKYTLNQRIAGITPIGETFPYFLYILMNRHPYFLAFDDGAKQTNLSVSDVMGFEAYYPKYSEQQKIGAYFRNLDHLITLQQRKLEVLKEQKKTYLKLLFPAKGQTKPALRFAGFEDEWKEVKLGEVFDIVTDYVANGSFESLRNNVRTYEKDNFAYMIRLQDASNSWKGPWLYTDEKGYNFLSKSRLFKDDILMSNVGTVGRFFQVPELDRPMTLAPNSVLIRSTSSNNQFLYFMMLTANIQDQITMRKTPGVQDKINKTDFKKVIATLPALSEQEAIGSFFQDLDKAIAKQEEKVNQLKESKQTLLRKMFI